MVRPDGEIVTAVGDFTSIDPERLAQRVVDSLGGPSFEAARRRGRGHHEYDAERHLNLSMCAMSDRVFALALFDAASTVGLVRLWMREMAREIDAVLRQDPSLEPVRTEDERFD